MRRGLRWSLAGVFGLMVAVSLMVIPALGEGPVTAEAGILRLQMNSAGDKVIFEPVDGSQIAPQLLSTTNCKLNEDSIDGPLMIIDGSNANAQGMEYKRPYAGLKDHRIGVGQTGEGNGEPCARINRDLGQKLTLTLGSHLDGLSIDYAEIDLGFKFNGDAILELRTGGPNGTIVQTETIPCNGQSDCGPDSGKSDNDRVVLYSDPDDVVGWSGTKRQLTASFDTITIRPGNAASGGSISLEAGFGGTEPGPSGSTDTIFSLVETFDGEIDCFADPVELGGGNATTSIIRGNDANSATDCKGPEDGLLFDFDSGVDDDGRLFVDFITEPVDGTAITQFLEVITWTFAEPPAVSAEDQFHGLVYDDHIVIDEVPVPERVMPWCKKDPRVGGTLPALLDPADVLPDAGVGEAPHTSCLIESTNRVTFTGSFVVVDVVYNIADGKRARN